METPFAIGSALHGVAVDAASRVWTESVQQPIVNQTPATWRIECIVATACVLSLVYSETSTITGAFATGTFQAGATLVAGANYQWNVEARRGVYMNFRVDATTTFKKLWVTQVEGVV